MGKHSNSSVEIDTGKSRSLEGRYANNFKVGHNACEFVLDFGQFFNGNPEENFHSRIVTNPISAKHLFEVLRISIDEYERKFEVISEEAGE